MDIADSAKEWYPVRGLQRAGRVKAGNRAVGEYGSGESVTEAQNAKVIAGFPLSIGRHRPQQGA